jgi:hypothetical protein
LSWHLKYWDTIDQLYWNPGLLGLTSIPKREWTTDGLTVSIPRTHLQNGGSIYTRKGSARENADRMRRLARLIHEPAALGRAGFDVSVAA